MIAKDVLSSCENPNHILPLKNVDSNMPLFEVLPHLLDAPERLLGVMEGENLVGFIDERSLLEGLGRLIAVRDDSSMLTIECDPEQYSASVISHAVEDNDVHLVDLLSQPSDNGKIKVNLRVRSLDSEGIARSLERYGYQVVESQGGSDEDVNVLAERLASLRILMNV